MFTMSETKKLTTTDAISLFLGHQRICVEVKSWVPPVMPILVISNCSPLELDASQSLFNISVVSPDLHLGCSKLNPLIYDDFPINISKSPIIEVYNIHYAYLTYSCWQIQVYPWFPMYRWCSPPYWPYWWQGRSARTGKHELLGPKWGPKWIEDIEDIEIRTGIALLYHGGNELSNLPKQQLLWTGTDRVLIHGHSSEGSRGSKFILHHSVESSGDENHVQNVE